MFQHVQRPLYHGHVGTSLLQKSILSIGSSILALRDPTRDDMVATLGETTGACALARLRDNMLAHPVGKEILQDRPRINSHTLPPTYLRTLADGTFGREYVRWLDLQGVSADTRRPVHFVDDAELAYVMQRYRETHDFLHVVLGFPVSVLGEVAVKWFEWQQTKLPMCFMAAVAGPVQLTHAERMILITEYLPWVMRIGRSADLWLNVYFEKHLEDPIENVRKLMRVTESMPL